MNQEGLINAEPFAQTSTNGFQDFFRAWTPGWLPSTALDAVGLVALADLTTVARRTALKGKSSLWDVLVLCPGLHRQQHADILNGGEYPACAAMTTGYVFRVENEATVAYLQRVGQAGHLTCLSVSGSASRTFPSLAQIAYIGAALTMLVVLALVKALEDWPCLFAVGILMFVRLVNVVIVKRRSVMGWKGEPEPDKQSDLIVLLSQDRWIRIRGEVNDVKAVTSGRWLREPTFLESGILGFSTLLMYLNVGLAASASIEGKVLLLLLLFSTAGLLGLANEYTDELTMYGRNIKVDGPKERFSRRLKLAKQLVVESKRHDWALRLGMLQPGDLDSADGATTKQSGGDAKRETQVVL